jgi:hypothetical protein
MTRRQSSHDAAIAALSATQAAQAVAHARLELQFDKLSEAIREGLHDTDENMRERFREAREDREKFQHDIREAIQGLATVAVDAAAAQAWIKSDGEPMREDHKRARWALKCVTWLGGIGGAGALIAAAVERVLKAKGWI